MTKRKNRFEKYLCDFCKETEMFSYEECWERLEGDKDCCVECLIKQKNRALELLGEYAGTHACFCDIDDQKYGSLCIRCEICKFLEEVEIKEEKDED